MNNAEVLVKFKGDTTDLDNKTKDTQNKITNLAKSFTIGALATKGITKAISIFNQGLDGAIARTDTMNNFPKVMSNLGIGAKDANEVVQDLSKQLQGLPTALDKATQSVQRLTTKTGDVKEAEKIFLALNNAILAGGASSDIQAQAMEQISQAFAKGKPDMMEWRSMMTAMPAQLKQVAQAMNYEDVASLGSAIREDGGEEEFARMIETMVSMNQKGIGSFKSFEEQARNATGGISTSATNMRTAVVRGISNMLNSINESTQQFGGISGILSSIGKLGEQVFTKIGNAMSYIIPKLYEVYNWYKKHELLINTLAIAIGTMIITFQTISKVIAIINAVKTAFALLNAVIIANPIGALIALIVGLVAGFIYLWKNCEGFRKFWINLWEGIKIAFGVAIEFLKNLLMGVINFIIGIPQTILTIVNSIKLFLSQIPYYVGYIIGYIFTKVYVFFHETIPNAITSFVEFLMSIPGKIWEIIVSIFNFLGEIPGYLTELWDKMKTWFIELKNKATEAFKNLIENIVNWFKELPGKMWDIGKNIVKGLWDGIKGMGNWIWEKITDFGKGILDGIKGALGIHSPSTEFAMVGKFSVLGYTEALDDMKGQVDKQIEDTFGISPQLANSSALHYSPNVVINNEVNVSQDPLGQMVSNIKSYSGGAKNDYNFGMGV